MKIEFPLWLVTNPDPAEDLAAICQRFDNFGAMERYVTEMSCPGGTLYTTEAEATADAQARLGARDGKGQWVPLRDLRPGAMFVTEAGLRGIRRRKPAPEPGRVRVVWLETGSDGNALDNLMVREVPL